MNRFRRYFLFRSILFLTVFGITVFFLKDRGGFIPLLSVLLVFVLEDSLLFFFQKRVKLFNILIDTTYLSIFIVFTGGPQSPFSPFYLTLIVLGAYLLTSIDSFIIAGYSGLLYGLICLVLPEYIPENLLLIELPEAPALPDVLLRFIIYSLSFLFTAALSSFIVERFRREVVRLRVTTSDILESLEYGIVTLDEKGRVVWTNSLASSLLNNQLDENESIFDIVGKDAEEAIREITSGDTKGIDYKVNDRVYHISANDLYEGQGTILMIKDITEEKKREEMMQVREKLITLGQFAASLAHGVRNPVSSIRASAELIDFEDEEVRKNKRLKKMILEESDHLDAMVKNFLDFSRNLEINSVEINLRNLTEDVITTLRKSKYIEPSMVIENNIGKDIYINADFGLLKTLMINLGTNSLKAMRNGGSLEFNFRENEDRYIEVRDTGYGIKKEDIDKIYSPFFSKFNDGFGFGLAIVKRIVEMHDWDIKVYSEVDRGTTFRIIL